MTVDESDGSFDSAGAADFLWRYRLLIGLTSLAFAVVAAILAFTAKPYFRAESVVSEVRERGMGGLGGLAGQLGGLASLAGVNLSGMGGAATQQYAATLESNHLAEEFIKRYNLLPELLANSSKRPTLWLGVKKFKEEVLTIRKDPRRGTTTLEVVWDDAATAARWANDYVALANEIIRARAMEDATRNVKYLEDQITLTNSVDLRKVMYNVIEEETKTLMLAKGREEYAFEIVDPAIAPELKAGPHRLLNTLVGTFLGFVVGTGAAFVHTQVRRARQRGMNNQLDVSARTKSLPAERDASHNFS